MNEISPPIPPPTPYSCTHCGLGLETPVEFCPQCGTRLIARHGAKMWLANLGIIALALLMIPAALLGACLVMQGGVFGGGLDFSFMGGAALAFAFTALCFWGIKKLQDK